MVSVIIAIVMALPVLLDKSGKVHDMIITKVRRKLETYCCVVCLLNPQALIAQRTVNKLFHKYLLRRVMLWLL